MVELLEEQLLQSDVSSALELEIQNQVKSSLKKSKRKNNCLETLKTSAKYFNNTRKFTESKHLPVWQIPDGYFAVEWNQMMLAH